MNWYEFVFSQERRHRLFRHSIFWLLWWAYFTASYYHYKQSGLKQVEFDSWNLVFFIKSLLLLFIHIAACYYFIVIVLPNYLLKRKYGALATRITIIGFFILISSYFLHEKVFPMIDALFHDRVETYQNIWWTSICAGLLSAPKIISAAATIKLIKRWWRTQKEKERFEKEKLITELQLLKAQLHPEFLFSSLNHIAQMTTRKENKKASMLLLKLSDILSYMLYDSDNKLVPVEKEINVIKDYLVLEKTRMGNRLEIDLAIKGDPGNKMIAPLLLFSIVENSFTFFGHQKTQRNWINLELLIGLNEITLKLIHGKDLNSASFMYGNSRTLKWLEFFYRDRYEFKTTEGPDMTMTSLRIILEPIDRNEYSTHESEQAAYATF